MAVSSLLKVENLKVSADGNSLQLRDISFSVRDDEIVSIVGKEGSGKTLICSSIMAKIEKRSGRIEFNAEDLEYLDTASRVKAGLSLVPQTRKIFMNLSVKDNLVIGGYTQKDNEVVRDIIKENYELFPRLYRKRNEIAGNLSSAEQMMLAIARGLMSDPILLIIDELTGGLSPIAREHIFEKLVFLKKCGTSILICQRKAYDCAEISDRMYLVDKGSIVSTGTSREIVKDSNFLAIYGEKKEEDDYVF